VLDVTLNPQIAAGNAAVEHALEKGIVVSARLDGPLVVGGQTVLVPPTLIFVRARLVGPGTRPNSVLIGLTTHWAQLNREAKQGGYELKSDEIVFTIAGRPPFPAGVSVTIPPDTRLRFTLGSTASSAAPAAGSVPARPAPVPPTTAAPPPATPGSPDPRQQADERRKQAERLVACQQQAIKDHPQGGLALVQALNACTQTK
jgi:hypothetical protein